MADFYTNDRHYKEEQQYREKYFFMPIKTGESRIELLYPTPFLTEDQADKLYEKYYNKYRDILDELES